MASNSVPKSRRKSAAVPVPESNHPGCYSSLVEELATLECVHATLVAWDLADSGNAEKPNIGSAELVLRGAISRLHDIAGEVFDLQDAAPAREISHV